MVTYLIYFNPFLLASVFGFVSSLTPVAMMQNGNGMMGDGMGGMMMLLCILGIIIALLLILLLVLLIIFLIKKIKH